MLTLTITLTGFLLFIYFLLKKKHNNFHQRRNSKHKTVMIVLGSGGHTQEMILSLSKFNFKLVKSLKIIESPCDKISYLKFDKKMKEKNELYRSITDKQVIKIPRTNTPFGNSNKIIN